MPNFLKFLTFKFFYNFCIGLLCIPVHAFVQALAWAGAVTDPVSTQTVESRVEVSPGSLPNLHRRWLPSVLG